MSINNLNNTHLTAAQIDAINTALAALEAALAPLTATLTPNERKTYGSVNEQNKLLVNKVWDYRRTSPELSVQDEDWVEFENDYNSRLFLEGAFNRLEALQEKMRDAKILHDYDNYQSALNDYSFTTYKAGSNAAGFQTKMNELKQFFGNRIKNTPPVEGGNSI